MLSKLGDVEFSVVTEESPEHENTITSHAVERGQDVSDHVKVLQDILPIEGVVVGDDAAQKLRLLREYRRSGQLLQYIGRNIFANVVIESLVTRHNVKVRNGFEFSITLKQVRIAQSREVSITAPGIGNSQTRPVQNAGMQQPKER